ncbi:MAG: LUD domain-containing protein [Candidatus Hydrogenedentes bacterium]|nr:LUD domain-containing protein [Candidatus Hydrogenedentota bacterium]
MSDKAPSTLEGSIREAIADRAKREALVTCMKRGRDAREEALAQRESGDAFRDEVKRVKEDCIERQEELLARFIENAKARGTIIFLAQDGPAAIQYILDLAQKRGAKTLAKSKSLTTEEIELNAPLEEAGLRVVETDLGELIIQLVNEKPYHLVFPSVHKTAREVAEIFEKETGRPVSSDIQEIMGVVREYLRPIFLNTDIGVTGANIGIAETGGIVIETNEGNGRLVSSIGDCHICVMGMEKIVETIEEAMLMVMAHPVSATGQCPTTYVTWMAGRSRLGEDPEQTRESHIVILDNGRRQMRDDPAMREALHCIRCGACMNICPTYGVVGGHTFGHIYPGPIGIPWTASVHGIEKAAEFAPLCISCGLCKEICPADIDMPMMIAEVKQRSAAIRKPTRSDRTMMVADQLAALGSATAPVSNWLLRQKFFRWLLEGLVGLDRRRSLPSFDRIPFTKRFSPETADAADATRRVAFFVDVYANYNDPQLAVSAVELLRRAGCHVVCPDQKASGYPFIAYGDLDRARKVAEYNVRQFAPLAEQGYDIVTLEPTAAYALTHSYVKLLDNAEEARNVAQQTNEFFEYLLRIEGDVHTDELAGKTFGFHCSCHQRPLGAGKAALAWLERRGATLQRIETGTCCGMGGTFGFKAGALGYDLSQAVGEQLFSDIIDSGVEAMVTESSVCKIHLEEGTKIPVYHPLELLR